MEDILTNIREDANKREKKRINSEKALFAREGKEIKRLQAEMSDLKEGGQAEKQRKVQIAAITEARTKREEIIHLENQRLVS